MPETPQEMYERCAGALVAPPVQEWESWPFEGGVTPKALAAPVPEPRIAGQDGVDCRACEAPDSDYHWAGERWRFRALPPSGLPLVGILEPREHFASASDLPEELAAEQGVMLGRVERAVLSAGGIARVHICRFGEGAEHLHWWFIGRPQGFRQLASSFAEIWDEVLPPVPEDIWRERVDRAVAALRAG